MIVLFTILAWMNLLAPGRQHGEMATAIARTVLDERPLFANDADRLKTAALVVSLTFRESSFRNDAKSATNDYCAAQIHARPELAHDLDKCLRVAMAMLRESIAACGAGNELGVYATGNCTSERGKRITGDRLHLAHKLAKVAP